MKRGPQHAVREIAVVSVELGALEENRRAIEPLEEEALQIADAFRDILQRLRRGSDPQAVHLPGNRSQADRHAPRVFLPSPSISFASEGVWKSVGDQQRSGSSCRLGACR